MIKMKMFGEKIKTKSHNSLKHDLGCTCSERNEVKVCNRENYTQNLSDFGEFAPTFTLQFTTKIIFLLAWDISCGES